MGSLRVATRSSGRIHRRRLRPRGRRRVARLPCRWVFGFRSIRSGGYSISLSIDNPDNVRKRASPITSARSSTPDSAIGASQGMADIVGFDMVSGRTGAGLLRETSESRRGSVDLSTVEPWAITPRNPDRQARRKPQPDSQSGLNAGHGAPVSRSRPAVLIADKIGGGNAPVPAADFELAAAPEWLGFFAAPGRLPGTRAFH